MSEINSVKNPTPQQTEAAGTLANTDNNVSKKETNTPSPLFNAVASPETAGSIASAATSSASASASASVNYSC